MTQMKLGWWRDREGNEQKVDINHGIQDWPFESSESCQYWRNDGSWHWRRDEHPFDLIEFIRPLEELAPELNSAVKAAEDMVRRLEAQYHAAQRLANEACENMNHARRELERLEKECEVKS